MSCCDQCQDKGGRKTWQDQVGDASGLYRGEEAICKVCTGLLSENGGLGKFLGTLDEAISKKLLNGYKAELYVLSISLKVDKKFPYASEMKKNAKTIIREYIKEKCNTKVKIVTQGVHNNEYEINLFYDILKKGDDIKLSTAVSIGSLYIKGNYCKYYRGVPQTPLDFEQGNVLKLLSVEEYISRELIKVLEFDKINLIGSGREDLDVLMLGDGRPSVIELINVRNVDNFLNFGKHIKEIENNIYLGSQKRVKLLNIKKATKDSIKELDINNKRKKYECLIELTDDIDKKEDLENLLQKVLDRLEKEKLENSIGLLIHQKTPIRVVHRRPNLTRERHITDLTYEVLSKRFIKIYLTTTAGTYVKEFVHGDFNRTQPSIKSLLNVNGADLIELNVLSILLTT
jgi:tRNA pseudouridine(54/55) synthase